MALFALTALILGLWKKQGTRYWVHLVAALCFFFLGSYLFNGGGDLNRPELDGPITRLIRAWSSDGPMMAIWAIFAICVTWIGSIWIVRKGFEKGPALQKPIRLPPHIQEQRSSKEGVLVEKRLNIHRVLIFLGVGCLTVVSVIPNIIFETGDSLFHKGLKQYNNGAKEAAQASFITACRKGSTDGCGISLLLLKEAWKNDPQYSDLRKKCKTLKNETCVADEIIEDFLNLTTQYRSLKLEKWKFREEAKNLVHEMSELNLSKIASTQLWWFCFQLRFTDDKSILSSASPLLEEAANRGIDEALYGEVILPTNPAQAHTFFEKAASKGHADAMRQLASNYLRGSGIAQNRTLGLAWLSVCAARGEEQCTSVLNEIKERRYLGIPLSSIESTALKIENHISNTKKTASKWNYGKIVWTGERYDFED